MIKKIKANRTPIIPNDIPPIMKRILHHLSPLMTSGSVNNREDREVMARTIIIIGETIPAFTAASPRINAPTVERALVVKVGPLRSPSLRISKAIIIIIASKKAGNGTDALWEAKLTSNWVGSIS